MSRYAGHVDEMQLYGAARSVLEGDDLNPHFFRYPSLPIYLTAASIYLAAAVHGDSGVEGRHLFSVPQARGRPYHPEELIKGSRLLFGALGAAVFLWVAIVAALLARDFSWAWLAPVMLAFCPLLQKQAVTYQNVDTPTVFFAFATVAAVLLWWESDSVWKKAVIPGVLAGLTVACKYNSGLVLVTCALAIALAPGVTRRLKKLTVLVAAAGLAFLLAVPYSLLDFSQFHADVTSEMAHYRAGHSGFDGPAGLPQLVFYLDALRRDYGSVISGLAVAGMAYAAWRSPRRAIAVAAFPVLMLVHMSTNRVHFLRTVLPLFVFVPVFAGIGVAGIARGIRYSAGRAIRDAARRRIVLGISAVAGIAVLAVAIRETAPVEIWADRNIQRDTRDRAVEWIRANAPEGSAVFVARGVWLAPADVEALGAVLLPAELRGAERVVLASKQESAVLLLPRYGHPDALAVLRHGRGQPGAYLSVATKRAKAANARAHRLVESFAGRKLMEWPGESVPLAGQPGRPARGQVDPHLTAYLAP